MLKRSLFFILSSICLAMSLPSCIDGDNEISAVGYAIINNNPEKGGMTMTLIDGEVAIPGTEAQVSVGDCVYVYYTINRDNQPHKDYYTATNVQFLAKTSQRYSTEVKGEDLENDAFYDGVIDGLGTVSYPMFKGVVFFNVIYTIPSKQTMNFDMFYNPGEIDEKGALTLYLKGKVSGDESPSKERTEDLLAFNLNTLIRTYGKPYTGVDGESDTMQLDIYIKYCDEVDEDGKCVYTALNSTPQKIYYY